MRGARRFAEGFGHRPRAGMGAPQRGPRTGPGGAGCPPGNGGRQGLRVVVGALKLGRRGGGRRVASPGPAPHPPPTSPGALRRAHTRQLTLAQPRCSHTRRSTRARTRRSDETPAASLTEAGLTGAFSRPPLVLGRPQQRSLSSVPHPPLVSDLQREPLPTPWAEEPEP